MPSPAGSSGFGQNRVNFIPYDYGTRPSHARTNPLGSSAASAASPGSAGAMQQASSRYSPSPSQFIPQQVSPQLQQRPMPAQVRQRPDQKQHLQQQMLLQQQQQQQQQQQYHSQPSGGAAWQMYPQGNVRSITPTQKYPMDDFSGYPSSFDNQAMQPSPSQQMSMGADYSPAYGSSQMPSPSGSMGRSMRQSASPSLGMAATGATYAYQQSQLQQQQQQQQQQRQSSSQASPYGAWSSNSAAGSMPAPYASAAHVDSSESQRGYRDQEKVGLLLRINNELLVEVMRHRDGAKNPEVETRLSECQKRLHVNLQYLATLASKSSEASPPKILETGPGIWTEPSGMPWLAQTYRQLAQLFQQRPSQRRYSESSDASTSSNVS